MYGSPKPCLSAKLNLEKCYAVLFYSEYVNYALSEKGGFSF